MPHSDFARAARHAHSYLGYTLAEKRCTQFGTCGANGDSSDSADRPSYVNRQLLSLYNEGLTYLRADADDAVVNCGMAEATKDKIVAKMTIPLVQGTIAYAYKSDPAVGYYSATADSEKALAEAWAFGSALLGQLNACSSAAAATVYDNLYVGLGVAGAVPDGYAAVKLAIEDQFDCLGISCTDVGVYSDMTDDANYAACGAVDKKKKDGGLNFVGIFFICVACFAVCVGVMVCSFENMSKAAKSDPSANRV